MTPPLCLHYPYFVISSQSPNCCGALPGHSFCFAQCHVYIYTYIHIQQTYKQVGVMVDLMQITSLVYLRPIRARAHEGPGGQQGPGPQGQRPQGSRGPTRAHVGGNVSIFATCLVPSPLDIRRPMHTGQHCFMYANVYTYMYIHKCI